MMRSPLLSQEPIFHVPSWLHELLRTNDLHLAAKPFEFNNEAQLPQGMQELADFRDHMELVPAIIQEHVQRALGPNGRLRPWMLDRKTDVDKDTALRELDEVRLILEESRYCQNEEASEAAWNDGVSSRVLLLALRGSPQVRHHNITTARPETVLLPTDQRGEHFDRKLVDYSVNLVTHPAAHGDDSTLEAGIRNLLANVPKTRQFVNQTLYKAVRFSPSSVSIETKASSTTDGRPQLSVWIAAWIEQMRFLRAAAASLKNSQQQDTSGDQMAPLGIQMPLVVAAGNIWKLYLATDAVDKIVISSLFTIGDTGSLLGTYCLVKSLRTLAAWTQGPFQEFIRKQILYIPEPS